VECEDVVQVVGSRGQAGRHVGGGGRHDLRAQIDRHLPEPLATGDQLRRWDDSVAALLRQGLLRPPKKTAG
jgi:hypothetical protein